MRAGRLRPRPFGLLLACLLVAPPASAQTGGQDALSGTLAKVAASGTMTLGHRTASFPFSYVLADRPVGYSIDLCQGVVAEIEREIDREVRIEYAPVTPETRIPALVSGQIDLECGSTTSTVERRKEVAFSPIIFVAGTKLMVRRDSPIRGYRDLAGRTVVVTAGTTNEAVVRGLDERNHLGLELISAPDHDASFAAVLDGRADAFATDDVLLSGLIARNRAADKVMIVGDFLSYEPYGLMYRRDDPAMAEAVDRAFATMAEDRDLLELYHRWFERQTITGERLNLPMSAQLAEIFRVLGVQD